MCGPINAGAHEPIRTNFTLTELNPLFERILTYSQGLKKKQDLNTQPYSGTKFI